jgi:hypothetical protein
MLPYLVLVCFAAAIGGFLFGFDTIKDENED